MSVSEILYPIECKDLPNIIALNILEAHRGWLCHLYPENLDFSKSLQRALNSK